MPQPTSVSPRAALSDRLLRFGAERSIQTREMERRIAALDPGGPGYPGVRAALSAAKAWEAAVLWVAWRLQPRSSADL
ncbi:MAG TPA: hypothetical protein VIC62_23530 [Nakamurella sp.]|jgi:hypothetical protein